ncbi:MAG: tRNA (adenosine(37)-N6)-threonylcarbamoyltransferase complex ATPase subunit type 1 TsaE [Roseobacter sp.]
MLLSSGAATTDAAAQLAPTLASGDTILLHGQVGAGKTHFSRAMIQSLLAVPEDVPSPTFTLVQTYDTKAGIIWHTDLYRIGSTNEIEELGLLDAFETAICLVEWPDKLGVLNPSAALNLTLTDGPDEDSRMMTAHWKDARWTDKLKCWIPK